MEQTPHTQQDALNRRIYLGNLPYTAKPNDIEKLLVTQGFSDLDKIHISIDPVSGRNPGYCFVDFTSQETTNEALASLSGTIRGRPIKVGLCEPKKEHDRGWKNEKDSTFQRWGNWSAQSSHGGAPVGPFNSRGYEQGPYGALDHFENVMEGKKGRRLYVGGLGRMINQAQHVDDITEIFSDFSPVAIGKRITPHESTRSQKGNHHYCFVDFETKDEAEAAMKALNGKAVADGRLKVSMAGEIPPKLLNSRLNAGDGRGVNDGSSLHPSGSSSGNTVQSNRAAASTNWRRKDNL
ncbi:hypothetical protein QQS21_004197 [Conoideocrella luteorostrata]|uniref:RRM domain-containing protein n=1 Tax=Conoideocrella luteorostrata TaxID=1105319 RepID=A0AAJ0CUB9_9HYPO|nr:hypothetical protein QQS21_004197 [Conoideocrella luteorostrata]